MTDATAAPPRDLVTSFVHRDWLEIRASGAWTAHQADALETQLETLAAERPNVRRIVIDLSRIEALDTFGAWLVERLRRDWSDGAHEAEVIGLPPRWQPLIDEVAGANHKPETVPPKAPPVLGFVTGVGSTVAAVVNDLAGIFTMLGAVLAALWRVIMRPSEFRFTSVVHHLDRVGFRAVPIVVLICFLIGAIVAQQGLFHFRRFGADLFVVDMVGILTMRELGVLLVAVMVAGRSGSAYTAELGSMKMREETDALRTMGFDPVDVLILPRIIALIIALPILTFLGSMASLFGGWVVAVFYGGLSSTIYLERLNLVITGGNFSVGMIKAPFMALVIGLVACMEGQRVQGSAESLGSHTTDSVVKSIFLVILLDGLFAVFFAAIDL